MLELALLRHAKSDWGDPNLRDFNRPLNARGKKAALRMGDHLRERGLRPGRILCSPAGRARKTLLRLGEGFADHPGLEFDEDLYLAAPATLLSCIAAVGEDANSLLVIAHNPGLEELALELAGHDAGSSRALTALAMGFVTAALAVFEVDGESFADIHHENARLVHFATPRGLG